MQLLNIFHTGGVTESLFGVAVTISGWLWYQAYKAHNSGWQQDTVATGHTEGEEKIPYKDIPQFWLGFAVWLAFILVMVLVVGPDYKGV